MPEEHTTYLGLCPVCAAKYKFLVRIDKKRVAALVQDILDSEDLTIPVQCIIGTMDVRFVETHLHDLQHALPNISARTGA